MTSDIYTNVPIGTERQEIRLVQLLPGHDDEQLQCSFHRHVLGCPDVEYSALSYTWGDSKSPTYTILIDGDSFDIHQNLWHFLKRQRENDEFGLIWIDAISIDQLNTSERNHQVSLMRDIYLQASRVFIWLGVAAEGSDLAIDEIQKFPRRKSAKKACRPIWSYYEGRALFRLCSRKYWRRIWIIQEIVLARDIIVLCGCRWFHWSCFEALAAELDQIDELRIHQHPMARDIRASDAMKLRSQRNLWKALPPPGKKLELYELLEAHYDAESTDVRDRVFGLLGLTSSPDMTAPLKADYKLSVRDLYTKTLTYINDRLASKPEGSDYVMLKKYAVLLQKILKLDHLEELATQEIYRLPNPIKSDKKDVTGLQMFLEASKTESKIPLPLWLRSSEEQSPKSITGRGSIPQQYNPLQQYGPPPLLPYDLPVQYDSPLVPLPPLPELKARPTLLSVLHADQNPPCNTLYVGNLPKDTSEDELKAIFSKRQGYKRLCFRTKQNGPMCFVEFEDIAFATRTLSELHGHSLKHSTEGGIRLSFSKNPLGVRRWGSEIFPSPMLL